jgi:hypothetical protein
MVSTDASEREASKRLRQLSARDQSLQRASASGELADLWIEKLSQRAHR